MLTSINALCVRVLAAMLFLSASNAAFAGPIYRVAVDTSSWSGSGYLDLTLTGLSQAPAVTATVSNFKGSFGAASETQGQVSGDIASEVSLVQGPSFNEFLQAVDFGGMFWFDVRFVLPPGVLDGANFGVALVNASLTAYLAGTDGNIATIALMPGAPDVPWADGSFAEIAEVSEPGSAAIFALGMLIAGAFRARAIPRRQEELPARATASPPSARAARHPPA